MKVIDVIPISRGIGKESLSYFTSEDAQPGAIVRVPLRGKTVAALVIGTENIEEKKAEIKAQSFSIKKAEGLVSKRVFREEFIAMAKKAAAYFATTTGSMLSGLIPKGVLESPEIAHSTFGELHTTHGFQKVVIQETDEERFAHYKAIIREEFARKSSVYLCLPTTGDIERAREKLQRGIEDYTFVFHGGLSKKVLGETWEKAIACTHSALIIATGQFFGIPRDDVGTIIVEREHSRSYKTQSRPYIDVRIVAELFAKEIGARIVYGDSLLRVETLWQYKNDETSELTAPKFRPLTSADQHIVDMRKRSEREMSISHELRLLIEQNTTHSGFMFIFVSRRGLAPLTLCSDCGSMIICSRCRAPIVLHSNSTERYFLCHRCGEKRSAEEKCKTCSGWRLRTLGIGSELLFEEIKKIKGSNVFRIDADTTTTHKKASETAATFYNSPGSILIGTEMALPYIDKVTSSAVASIDAMFALPDFRINEKILYILLKIRAATEKDFLIQTRNSKSKIFEFVTQGNLLDFYKSEIADREMFDLPPFSTLIKISLTGTEKLVKEEMAHLKEFLADYSTDFYPAFTPHARGSYTMNALVRLTKGRWIDNTLLEKLLSLPPHFNVIVDPESVL